jgi:hypothetical protein
MKAIVVGARLAGLTCAKALRERGVEVASLRGVGRAGALTGEAVPEGSEGEVCICYETDGLGSGKKILLNAEDGAFVNNAVEMSNISEKYAPPERHLLYTVALTGMDLPDEDLYRRGIGT